METQQGALMHPLAGKEVTHIQSWGEWRERWDKETCTEVLHSLLHFGFSVSADRKEAVERLCLYLEIADNGDERLSVFSDRDERLFRTYKGFGGEVFTKAGLRGVLAQKAFQALCQNFFKNTTENSYELPSWAEMVIIPQVLAKLFWFFRSSTWGDVLNIFVCRGGEHQKQIATDFVRDFCLFVWDCGDDACLRSSEITEEVRTAFRQARPDVITLLVELDELNLLLNRGRYEGMDRACLDRIESFAFGRELHMPDGDIRKPRTIEEACLGKSKAARVLLVLRTLLSEKERFNKICELKQQRLEAERNLAKWEVP